MTRTVAAITARAGSIAALAPRYVAAAVAVGAAFLLRLALDPWLGETHAYGAFYPAIFLVAYVLGRPSAYFAAVLAGVAGLWFVQPEFGWDFGPASLAPLAFFALTAGAGVWLITALTAGLDALAVEQGRSKAIADAHAELFKDLQARIGHHMQLISGVLMLQAHGETDGQMLELLRKAGERSQMIARAHRAFSDHPEKDVDFAAFAVSLARSVCTETGHPDDLVEIRASTAVRLPFEAATSLGVALVECLLWLLKRKPAGVLRVDLEREAEAVRLRVSHSAEGALDVVALAPTAYMFRAMVDQLGASVELSANEDGRPGIEISLPLGEGPRRSRPSQPDAATLH